MTKQMTQLTAGGLVEALFDALESVDIDAIRKLIHPDVEVIEPEVLPYGGIYHGADAFFTDLLPAIVGPVDFKIASPEIIDGGQVAAVRMKIKFTSRRTGKTVHMPYVEIYEMGDGMISRIDVYPQDAGATAEWLRANR